jgi:hypothetical protein
MTTINKELNKYMLYDINKIILNYYYDFEFNKKKLIGCFNYFCRQKMMINNTMRMEDKIKTLITLTEILENVVKEDNIVNNTILDKYIAIKQI